MKKPDLGRYDERQLDSMLFAYRQLAREHITSGHYALGKWATRMVTWISLEINDREQAAATAAHAQIELDTPSIAR